jgi:O-antigen/teichoic acid export membrane protein
VNRGDAVAAPGEQGRRRRPPRLTPVLRDTTTLAGSRLAVAALGWAGTLILIRVLSRTGFGQYSLVFGVLGMLEIVTQSLAPRVALRGLTDSADPEVFFGGYVMLRSALGVLAYGVAMGFVVVAGYPPVVVRTTAVAGLVLVNVISDSYWLVLTIRQELYRLAIAQLLGQLVQLALTVGLALLGASVTVFTLPVVAGEVVVLAYILRCGRAMIRPRYRLQLRSWKPLLWASVPVAVGEGLVILYQNVDSILLSKLQGFQAVAIYNVGSKFTILADVFPMAVSFATAGVLAKAWPELAETFYATVRNMFLALTMAAGLVIVEFSVFAPQAIALLYGNRYAVAATAARLVVAGACVAFLSIVATAALAAQGRNSSYVIAGAAGLVLNVGLNLVLIPWLSYTGAGIVTLVSEAAVTACQAGVLLAQAHRRVMPWRPLGGCVVGAGVAAAVAVGTARLLPWPAAAALAGVAYLGALHLLRVNGPQGLRSFGLDVAG